MNIVTPLTGYDCRPAHGGLNREKYFYLLRYRRKCFLNGRLHSETTSFDLFVSHLPPMGPNAQVTNPTYCNVAILPVATNDLPSPISPRFSPSNACRYRYRCKFDVVIPRQLFVEFYFKHVLVLISATEARVKELIVSNIELTTPTSETVSY